MFFRSCYLAAALGVGIGGVSLAQAPTTKSAPATKMTNQEIANTVVDHLKKSGVIAGTKGLTIEVKDEVVPANEATKTPEKTVKKVYISGTAKNDQQIEAIIDVVRSLRTQHQIPINQIDCNMYDSSVKQIGGQAEPMVTAPPLPSVGDPAPRPMPIGPIGAPPMGNPAPGGALMIPTNDPAPIVAPGLMPGPYDAAGPTLPPYAWPTYAPYNNMSRVAYPQAYPYNAFPFIGPFYPFPKVPLGWRKVSLEFEDGHWYLNRHSTKRDYWRVKFF